jgi:hypothetical protein
MGKWMLRLIVVPLASLAVCCGQFKVSEEKNYDSLFVGISFGMERKAFFDYCWEMNKQKIFTHSPTNQAVEYKITNELPDAVMMRFYPSFHENKIYEVPVVFTYEAWAPWNKHLSADTLFVKMLPIFKKWYGEDFKLVKHPQMGNVFVKIDGKRRINLFIRDDQYVQAVFTDLKVKKIVEDQKNNKKDQEQSKE